MKPPIPLSSFGVPLLFLTFTAILLSADPACAAGTSSAAFLDIPVGAGPAALGSAYSALATDVYAAVWNPAGLGFLPAPQIAGQHLAYLESIHSEFVSGAIPLGRRGGLAASAQFLGSGDIPSTDRNGASIGDYSDTFGAYGMSYGHAVTDRLALGMGAKWIRMALADVKADGFAMDAGALYRMNDHIQTSLVVQNAGGKIRFLEESDPLPTTLRAGVSYSPGRQWTFVAETALRKENPSSVQGGVEWSPVRLISLRTGYRSDTLKGLSGLAGFSMGMGLHVWGQEFAYAWVPKGDLGNTQYFSVLLTFGQGRTDGHTPRTLKRSRS